MKQICICTIVILLVAGCNSSAKKNPAVESLQLNVDSLQQQLDNAYKPGLGEFMLGIQSHHTKLWFAGENENWDLAKFEIEEIEESFDDIKIYAADRPEIAHLHHIEEPVAALTKSIGEKNKTGFENAYQLLTNACNSCHEESNFRFNHIIIPTGNGFPDQDFAGTSR